MLDSTNEIAIQNHSSVYYERRYTGYGKRYHAQVIQQLLQGAQGHILDAGCGTGFVSTCMPTLDIVGIDLSPGMLQRYQGKMGLLMDVCKMPRAWSGTFDFVVCRSLLHHLPNHLLGMAEMSRVMRIGAPIRFWETNQSALASWVRARTQHGDRFSAFHRSFKDTELLEDIRKWFVIDDVRYIGFSAYPCFGFPDIINIASWIPFKSIVYPTMMSIDDLLSNTKVLKKFSWSILIKGRKV